MSELPSQDVYCFLDGPSLRNACRDKDTAIGVLEETCRAHGQIEEMLSEQIDALKKQNASLEKDLSYLSTAVGTGFLPEESDFSDEMIMMRAKRAAKAHGLEKEVRTLKEQLRVAREALGTIINFEWTEWKPMQVFRSDAEVARDEARHAMASEIADIAREALAQIGERNDNN